MAFVVCPADGLRMSIGVLARAAGRSACIFSTCEVSQSVDFTRTSSRHCTCLGRRWRVSERKNHTMKAMEAQHTVRKVIPAAFVIEIGSEVMYTIPPRSLIQT